MHDTQPTLARRLSAKMPIIPILFTCVGLLLLGSVRNPPSVDEVGGFLLVYKLAESENAAGPDILDSTRKILIHRLDPAGKRGVTARVLDDRTLEIAIPTPDGDKANLEVDQRLIGAAGVLRLQIVANARDHSNLISLARKQAQDPARKISRTVLDERENPVGSWVEVPQLATPAGGLRKLKVPGIGNAILRDTVTGEILDLSDMTSNEREDDQRVDAYLARHDVKKIDMLLVFDKEVLVSGEHFGEVSASMDETMNVCVNFRMTDRGAELLRQLTSQNVPDSATGHFRKLAIQLDDMLITAPRIVTAIGGRGRITGNFTKQEVDFYVNVLRAGQLPIHLAMQPVRVTRVEPKQTK